MPISISINERVVIDTSFWVSLYFLGDTNNVKASKLLEAVNAFVSKAYITDFIFGEVATVLSQKLGKRDFVRLYGSESALLSKADLFRDSGELIDRAREEFLAVPDKDISFTDVHTALVAKELGADVMTFDGHFKKLGKRYGFRVYP